MVFIPPEQPQLVLQAGTDMRIGTSISLGFYHGVSEMALTLTIEGVEYDMTFTIEGIGYTATANMRA